MSNPAFINRNKSAIKKILDKMGAEENNAALKRHGLEDHKPISIDGFYIEYDIDTKDEDLWYTYPSGVSIKLYSVLGFQEVPPKGWEMKWEKL